MVEKIRKNIKALMAKVNPSAGSIQFFRFKPAHAVVLAIVGLLLVIPSVSTLINTAVPMSWEKVAGSVSAVAQNEVASGGKKYVATVVYRLNYETYNIREEYVGDRPARDDQVVIYYNPTKPSEAMVQRGGPLSFLAWIPLLAGLGLIIFTGVKSYKSWRRSQVEKALVSKGKSVPSVVSEAEVKNNKTLLQKMLYKDFIFFKLKAAPLAADTDSEELYESDLLMWRGKMYGDVNTLKEQSVPVGIYVSQNNTERYYFEPPKVEADEVESVEAPTEDNKQPVPETFPPSSAGYSSIQVPQAIAEEIPVSPIELSESPAPLGLDMTQSSVTENNSNPTTPTPVVSDNEDLALEDIDQLEKSLAGINVAPAAIDLNFTDDPENINNTPAPMPSQPVVTPIPVAAVAPAPQIVQPTPAPQVLATPAPVEAAPQITGMSSQTSKSQPSIRSEAAPAISRHLNANPGTVIQPVTNINESMTSEAPANTPVTMTASVSVPQATTPPAPTPGPTATPAPAITRSDRSSASRGNRGISIPRR